MLLENIHLTSGFSHQWRNTWGKKTRWQFWNFNKLWRSFSNQVRK